MFFFSLLSTPFKPLFAFSSPSPRSKLFRYSKCLGKTIGKKWSQNWILLLIKAVKSPRKKSLIFDKFCAYYQDFFGIGATIRIGGEMLCLPYAGFFEDISTKDQLINKSVSNQGVSITAPATAGLLKSSHFWDPRIWLKMVMPYLVTIR